MRSAPQICWQYRERIRCRVSSVAGVGRRKVARVDVAGLLAVTAVARNATLELELECDSKQAEECNRHSDTRVADSIVRVSWCCYWNAIVARGGQERPVGRQYVLFSPFIVTLLIPGKRGREEEEEIVLTLHVLFGFNPPPSIPIVVPIMFHNVCETLHFHIVKTFTKTL